MKRDFKSFPPQTGQYVVRVKNGAGWHAYDVARFHISVGQEYHEGDKFKATMDWAKSRFEKVIICVNDTLQRHNFSYLSKFQAFDYALKEGDLWLDRNKAVIECLPNYEIFRWEDWKKFSDSNIWRQKIQNLYQADENFKNQVEQEINVFWSRRLKRFPELTDSDFILFQEHSCAYLLEEIAVFFTMFAQERAVDIYPGSILLPCVMAPVYLDGFDSHGLGQRGFTRIDFLRRDMTPANDLQAA